MRVHDRPLLSMWYGVALPAFTIFVAMRARAALARDLLEFAGE